MKKNNGLQNTSKRSTSLTEPSTHFASVSRPARKLSVFKDKTSIDSYLISDTKAPPRNITIHLNTNNAQFLNFNERKKSLPNSQQLSRRQRVDSYQYQTLNQLESEHHDGNITLKLPISDVKRQH